MLRATLKNVTGHKVRLVLTAMSVVLGVAFVAGTFVLTDSIKTTFDALFTQAAKNTAVVVRGQEGVGQTETGDGRAPVPLALADRLTKVDGVAKATPDIAGSAVLVGKDGTAVRRGGAPTFGFAADPDDDTFVLDAGRLPTAAGEVAVEQGTLALSKLAVGDRTRVVAGDDVRDVQVVGSVRFGDGVSLAGSTAVLFDDTSARRYFSPDGTVQSISLRADPGLSQAELRDRVAAVLPADLQAVTGAQQAEEDKADLNSGLKFINVFLLVFAGIALFVGSFIIFNTFSMLVAQRTRELALLRALGASRRQVTRSVLGEAVIVGLLSSVVGLLLGLGVAALLKVLFGTFGLQISAALPVRPRTVIAAFAVGLIVTTASAYFPARRASKVAPVAAMREDTTMAERGLRLRTVLGALVTALGVAGLLGGLAAHGSASGSLVGLGAGLTFVGVAMLAPVIAPPVVRLLALPYRRVFGTVGNLARENALRSPRRTATTASALMIGMALVSGVTILASSTRAVTSDLVDEKVKSDFVLSSGGQLAMPGAVVAKVRALPQVSSAAPLSGVPLEAGGFSTFAIGIDAADLRDNVVMDVTAGSIDALDRGELLVDSVTANEQHWTVGQEVTASIGFLKDQKLRIGGVFEQNQALGSTLVGRSLYERAVPAAQRGDLYVYVKTDPGTDPAAARAALAGVVEPFAVVSVQDRQEFKNAQAGQVNTLLYIIYGLLALAVIIAILGIINTLALSVIERTREIGLLRAVGLDRRQLRRAIRLESVLIAVFGAVLGTALGIFFAVALQRSLADDGLDRLAVPVVQLLLFLVFAALVGVLAALWPARRAARLDVLRAVTTE